MIYMKNRVHGCWFFSKISSWHRLCQNIDIKYTFEWWWFYILQNNFEIVRYFFLFSSFCIYFLCLELSNRQLHSSPFSFSGAIEKYKENMLGVFGWDRLTLEVKIEEGIPIDMGKDVLGSCSNLDPELDGAVLMGQVNWRSTMCFGNISN